LSNVHLTSELARFAEPQPVLAFQVQGQCKANAIELARFAEPQPVLAFQVQSYDNRNNQLPQMASNGSKWRQNALKRVKWRQLALNGVKTA